MSRPDTCSFSYYPTGHRSFLERHPDTLAKKSRIATRVPLWERPLSSSQSDVWWDEDWLDLSSPNWGRYPLLCRVERVHAEFPPDPFAKSTSKDSSQSVQVTWKAPKDKSALIKARGSPVRLAIGLRPVTPAVAPSWSDSGSCIDLNKKPIPPFFSVVVFPSELPPFVVPFAWAYATAHSFSKGDKVSQPLAPGSSSLIVKDFETLGNGTGTMRLEDKREVACGVVKRLTSQGLHRSRERELSTWKEELSWTDAKSVLGVLSGFGESDVDTAEEAAAIDIMDLVRSTLPLWDSVVAIPSKLNRQKHSFTPWELMRTKSKRSEAPPFFTTTLDIGLRDKVDFIIETLLLEDESAFLFDKPVSDDDAPSYSCAVPVGMSFSRIVARLALDKRTNSSFYRNVEAVQADIMSILENCLLYNSPDSAVVESAVRVVTRLRESISGVAQHHFRELAEARRIDLERRNHVFDRTKGDKHDKANHQRSFVISTLKNPFMASLERGWLMSPVSWIPQAGEKVLYSSSRHSRFLQHHYPSLDADQCAAMITNKEKPDDWVLVSVQWTCVAFPKSLAKASSDDATTFHTNSPLLGLFLKDETNETSDLVYWRPCLLPGEAQTCACGLNPDETFIRCAGTSEKSEASNISDEARATMDTLLSVLKFRCLRAELPSSIDPKLTKESARSGYKPAFRTSRLKTLPCFDKLFSIGSQAQADKPDEKEYPVASTSTPSRAGAGTRKKQRNPKYNSPEAEENPKQSKNNTDSQLRLSEAGFLPSWACAVDSGVVAEARGKCATVIPFPELCLELVHQRLMSGHYRHLTAIENDIVESFVTTAVLAIKEVVQRKRSGVTMRKLARLLCSAKIGEEAQIGSEEDLSLLQRVLYIRDLHATALAASRHPAHVALVFGLVNVPSVKVQPVPILAQEREQNPVRADARQRLENLLTAIGRDHAENIFPNMMWTHAELPTGKLRVVCGGERFTYTKQVKMVTQREASWNENLVKVKFICNKRPVPNDEDVDTEEACLIPRAQLKSVVEDCIHVHPHDFEESASISQFFFARPGLTEPCARCKAYKRSFLNCRVRKAHENKDFDWLSTFKGTGGIDGLLQILHPNPALVNSLPSTFDDDEPSRPHTERLHTTIEEDTTEEKDPSESVLEAADILKLANGIQSEAKKYSEAPAKLGEDFIRTSFPVDLSDGHYIYCIVCGMSGDLVCCDGCANVLHPKCIGEETELGDGDWFCEECKQKGRGTKHDDRKLPGRLAKKNGKKQQTFSPVPDDTPLPFGRNEFDEAILDNLTTRLEMLRSTRPENKRLERRKSVSRDSLQMLPSNSHDVDEWRDEADDNDDFLGTDDDVPVRMTRGRQRVDKTVEDMTSSKANGKKPNESPITRRRGRPRKYPVAISLDREDSKPLSSNHRRKVLASEEDSRNEKVAKQLNAANQEEVPTPRRSGRIPKNVEESSGRSKGLSRASKRSLSPQPLRAPHIKRAKRSVQYPPGNSPVASVTRKRKAKKRTLSFHLGGSVHQFNISVGRKYVTAKAKKGFENVVADIKIARSDIDMSPEKLEAMAI